MRARGLVAAAAAYVVIAVLWAMPMTARPTERVPDLGDPLHLAWTMAWDAHALVGQPWRIYDANAFHPYPRSLTFADHLMPEALMVAPIFWTTGNAVLAFNAAVVIALAFSATAMFLLVRHLTASAAAAFVAGLVYAFNSLTLHELPRAHVLNVQWWPLALLWLDRYRSGGRRRDAVLAAAALALQGLSGTYYLVYTALLTPLWLIVTGRGRPRPAPPMRPLLVALALAAVIGAALLWPYAAQIGALGFEKGWTGGADVLAYLEPAPRSLIWPALKLTGRRSELPHFVGLLTLALAIFGLVRFLRGRAGTRPVVACALVAAAMGLIFSFGPIVHLAGHRIGTGPYELLARWRDRNGSACSFRLGWPCWSGSAWRDCSRAGQGESASRWRERWPSSFPSNTGAFPAVRPRCPRVPTCRRCTDGWPKTGGGRSSSFRSIRPAPASSGRPTFISRPITGGPSRSAARRSIRPPMSSWSACWRDFPTTARSRLSTGSGSTRSCSIRGSGPRKSVRRA